MGRIMALDFGSKRCGLAVSDPGRMIAGPVDVVAPESLISYLRKYFAKEKVAAIVIGLPLELDGKAGDLEGNIQAFIVTLRKEFPWLEVHRIDERFTSKLAQKTILDAGIKKMKRREKSMIDQVSAVIILQEYLDQINRSA